MARIWKNLWSAAALLALSILLAGCPSASSGAGGTGTGPAVTGTLTYGAGAVVYATDLATGNTVSLFDGYYPYRHENGLVAFVDSNRILLSDGVQQSVLVDDCSLCDEPTISPDGEYLAYVSWATFDGILDFHAIVRWLDTNEVVAAYRDLERPVWGPDGLLVMAGNSAQEVYGLYRVMPDTSSGSPSFGSATRFDPDLANPGEPAISPDGSSIVFVLNNHLYLMSIDGNDLQQLTSGTERDAWPTWSPSGRYIAYQAGLTTGSSHGHVAVIDLETAGTAFVRDAQGDFLTASGQMTWR